MMSCNDWCFSYIPSFSKMATEVSSISFFEQDADSYYSSEVEEQQQKSKIAIKLSYNKLGQTEYTIQFDQYIDEFSSLLHVLDTPQLVHPCDLCVSPTLVSRFLFYKKQIARLSKQGIGPDYAEEMLQLIETQILKKVKEFIEPTHYALDTKGISD
jgi:hypothetical protein